ncbi:hypothetical protein YB2330_000513 [Saitoella coloradoensis]
MAAILKSVVIDRVLGDRKKNLFNQEDPYFEPEVPGQKRKRKGIPPGLNDRDAKILKKVRRKSYRLDRSISCICCSFRFGWSAIIGFVPVIGDVLDALLAYNVIRTACDADLPPHVVSQMYANLAFDFGIGLIPIVGDIADMIFKCNTRNTLLLEQVLIKRAQENMARQGATGGHIDAPQESHGWFAGRKKQHTDARQGQVGTGTAAAASSYGAIRGGQSTGQQQIDGVV